MKTQCDGVLLEMSLPSKGLTNSKAFLRNERLSARSARKRVEHPLPRSAYARRKNLFVYA